MRIQKLTLVTALALGGVLACATVSPAQDANAKSSAPDSAAKQTNRPPRGPGIDQRLERLSTELNLTEAQKPKVKAALEENMKNMQELRNVPREERRDKMREVRTEHAKKMKEILTPDQLEKYKKMQEEMRQRRPGGPGAPDAGGQNKSADKKTE